MVRPRVLVLRSPGANCDGELAFAFELAGAQAQRVHIRRLRENPKLLHQFNILAVPGGFTYGDDVAAGRILASQLATFFGDTLREFRDQEKLIIGVCNGFQALLRAGLLFQSDEEGPLATLARNSHGRFEDRWVNLVTQAEKCVWLQDIVQLEVPTAHGEGNFRARAEWYLRGWEEAGQIVLRYADAAGRPTTQFPANPNGSQAAVAGVTDPTGRVLGLMPHPERNVLPTQHPQWTRRGLRAEGEGLRLFRNAVQYFD